MLLTYEQAANCETRTDHPDACGGCSLRATSRMADVSINTVTKLLVDVAEAAMPTTIRWCETSDAVGSRRRNLVLCRREGKECRMRREQDGWGDVWTWTAIDADTKLCVSYLVGGRDGWWATEFMRDVASRIRGPCPTDDGRHRAYLDAVEDAFGADVDYAELQKIYGASD